MSDTTETGDTTETERQDTEAAKSEEKTLTQAEVDRIVQERLARERSKYADYDELKQKAEAADSSKTDLEKLQEQLADLQQENETNKVKALRSEVASDKGVPANLLTGTTQEDMEAQAEALLEFAKSKADKPASASRPKESLRSGAANNDREPSAADIARDVLKQRQGF